MKNKLYWMITLGFLLLISTACTHTVQETKLSDASPAPYSLGKKLDVPIINQNPELHNGCEVTSLAMLLKYAGISVDKMTLANEIKKDPTPVTYDAYGKIQTWGNPYKGFVGDITGENIGYGVYQEPLLALLETYLPEQGIDLTGQSFTHLLQHIDQGYPIVVWVTINFSAPDEYVKWQSDDQTIVATFDEHAVLLVGYDKKYCFINNPYTGEQCQKIKRDTFKDIWNIMGSMAISYH